jgi:hypothetical protein
MLSHPEIADIFESSPQAQVYRDRSCEHFPVASVVSAARSRHPRVPDIERQLDAFVRNVGGQRVAIVDPWRALGNLGRRLIKQPPQPVGDLYVVPTDVFRGAS